ncbi:MAG: phosphoenolpyruvate--protein phosphotransferase [Gammaproteobacteria bacterium]
MLSTLRHIIQEVNDAVNLAQALDIIVLRVKQALSVDVCSVYLATPGKAELVLMATEGLNPESKRRVRLNFSEGLVGLVAERAESVNLDDAANHPRFKYFPETGEERYHAFLGVPIVHHRQLLGVVVVQARAIRRFDDDDASFLITLAAQLSGAISHAEVSGEISALRGSASEVDVLIRGISGAPGVAIGTAVVAYAHADLEAVPDRTPDDAAREEALFRDCVLRVQQEMLQVKERMGSVLPAEERVLFDAYVMMLGSDYLVDPTIARIHGGSWAQGALRDTIREIVRKFADMDDAYLSERADDIWDLGRRILVHLQQSHNTCEPRQPEHIVLMGANVGVVELAEIPHERLAGVVSEGGSSSSHVAILARALGIPAVMGVADLPAGRLDGREVIVDGYAGRVFIQPSEQVRREFERLAREEREFAAGLTEFAEQPAVTKDGVRMPIFLNSGLLADIDTATQRHADGIGLYRTEFPFMIREQFPSEDEQFRVYRQVLESVAPRPATLRTLDVGGDKMLSYFPVKEDNPFLGWRGIRIMLDHPEIFLTQLRAMLRANEGLNNLQVLLPMVTSVSEVDESLRLLQRAGQELSDEGVAVAMPKVGVMVEVPSAVYLAGPLAQRVDFLSVGTNDLVQYLLAVDRNNSRVADLYHALHPAVLRALREIVIGAHKVGRPVSICGEMAGDPASIILLLGMEIDSLSVSLASLPRVKWVVRSFSRADARAFFDEALDLQEPDRIRELLNNALIDAGLGGLVRAGKS